MSCLKPRMITYSRIICGRHVFNFSSIRAIKGYRLFKAVSTKNISSRIDFSKNRGMCSEKEVAQSTVTADLDDGEAMAFKAETKKLLQIVAHSLYKDKDVFIREQISNAVDALEKLRFFRDTNKLPEYIDADVPLKITLSTDPQSKTFTIQDTGIGMTKEELIENLGTIAKSGSEAFAADVDIDYKKQADAIIGQFGVGFYSSFVVSDKVEVYTRSCTDTSGKGWKWTSHGLGSFSIKECEGLPRGTKIVCHLKDDCLEFANPTIVKSKASLFSSFMNFPIYIVESENEIVEINKQEALWFKSNPTPEEHLQFFRHISGASWGDIMYTVTFKTDAPLAIKSIFYIPEEAPSRLFQTKNEVKVSLHSRRVLVKKSAEDVIPKWLFFVEGVIDSEDMPLNVSRETMQDSRLIEKLSNTVIKRLLKFLIDEARNNPEKFKKFHDKYSYYLKEGLLEDLQKTNRYKDDLLKLIRFDSTLSDGKITLEEYIESSKPGQQNIYYFCAPDRATAMSSPYMENFIKRERNVLLLFEDIDEFVAMNLQNFKDRKLVAIDSSEEDFEPTLEENVVNQDDSMETISDSGWSDLERYIKATLGSKVSAIKYSERLNRSPAVVTGFLSSTLRKMMKATLRGAGDAQLNMSSLPVTLELNRNHVIVKQIYHLMTRDSDTTKLLVEQLYDNACVAAGIMDDPRQMLNRLDKLLEVTSGYAYQKLHDLPSVPLKDDISSKNVYDQDNNELINSDDFVSDDLESASYQELDKNETMKECSTEKCSTEKCSSPKKTKDTSEI